MRTCAYTQMSATEVVRRPSRRFEVTILIDRIGADFSSREVHWLTGGFRTLRAIGDVESYRQRLTAAPAR